MLKLFLLYKTVHNKLLFVFKMSSSIKFKKSKRKCLSGDPIVRLPPFGKQFKGFFNGFSVIVEDPNEQIELYSMGFFGKGNLSKSGPTFNLQNHETISEQTYKMREKYKFPKTNHKMYLKGYQGGDVALFKRKHDLIESTTKQLLETSKNWSGKPINCIIDEQHEEKVEISDNLKQLVDSILDGKSIEFEKRENHDIMVVSEDLSVKSMANIPKPNEVLTLSLQEAHFLSILKRLKIFEHDQSEMSINDQWKEFSECEPEFGHRFATYVYYRSRNWVPRSGLRFGGDYLLYEDGPAYTHSRYLIKMFTEKDSFSWSDLIASTRVAESVNKDFILCHTFEDKHLEGEPVNFKVKEILCRRWQPN